MLLRPGESLADRLQAEGVHPALVIRMTYVPVVVRHTVGPYEITLPLTIDEQIELATTDFILRPYFLLRARRPEWDTAMTMTGMFMLAIMMGGSPPDDTGCAT